MDRLKAIVWFNEDKERDWRAAPTPEIAAASPGAGAVAGTQPKPKLSLILAQPPRAPAARPSCAGAHRNAASVVRWHAYLNGRRVKTASRRRSRSRASASRGPGRYRWTVTGRDARGRTVVSARRAFRVRG